VLRREPELASVLWEFVGATSPLAPLVGGSVRGGVVLVLVEGNIWIVVAGCPSEPVMTAGAALAVHSSKGPARSVNAQRAWRS
jgi:hypothetical protein